MDHSDEGLKDQTECKEIRPLSLVRMRQTPAYDDETHDNCTVSPRSSPSLYFEPLGLSFCQDENFRQVVDAVLVDDQCRKPDKLVES